MRTAKLQELLAQFFTRFFGAVVFCQLVFDGFCNFAFQLGGGGARKGDDEQIGQFQIGVDIQNAADDALGEHGGFAGTCRGGDQNELIVRFDCRFLRRSPYGRLGFIFFFRGFGPIGHFASPFFIF